MISTTNPQAKGHEVDSQVETVDGGRSTENTTSRPVEDSVTEVGLGNGLVCNSRQGKYIRRCSSETNFHIPNSHCQS